MKTIERLDFPIRVYFRDGECHHDSAVIVFTHGAPAYVRASGPFAIYTWEHVERITGTADKDQEPDLAERLRASVVAIADERNGAKQEAHTWRAEVERLKASNAEHRVALRDALGLTYDNHDHAGLCAEVKRIRAEWDHLSRYNSPEKLARLELRSQHDRDMLAKALGVDARDVDHGDLCARVKSMQADLASVTEQRDVLKRQLEELRAEMRKHKAPARATVMRGINKGEVVEVLEANGSQSRVRFDNGNEVMVETSFLDKVTSSPLETKQNPPDAEHQQVQNRDKWRATCLANGAKDCTVYFGPGDEVTFVVEMSTGRPLMDVMGALWSQHKMRSGENYTIREVRPIVDGVKPSAFKHPADNGQP